MLFGNPIILLIPALLIPLIYSLLWKKSEFKTLAILFLTGILIVFLYPITTYLPYALGKLIIFVILPILALFYMERWSLRKILSKTGIHKLNLQRSILYGLAAAAITITITILVSTTTSFDLIYRTIMFFEAFTEEFLFRGVLLLYLAKKTNLRVAYLTSILGFILIHPQHFTSLFIFSTASQAILLVIVANKTQNIIGPWISHGLNRFLPSLVKTVFGI
jgi:membrane protease YdiL (CAAX protease family)